MILLFSAAGGAAGSACMKRFTAAAGAAGFPLFKGCRSCQREAIRGGDRHSRLPLFKDCRFCLREEIAAAAGAADFPLLKRLPVLPARRDSRRALPQQASHC
ncbi:MAG: hypothetical protein ACLRRT_15630 [Ruthenibacterium lactatiformans]